MAKKRVIVMYHIKPGTGPDTLAKLKSLVLQDFVPAEKEAPGLLSIEVLEPPSEPIPHVPDNSATELAFIELWKDAESNNDWWAGDIFAPKSQRMKKVMAKFRSFLESPDGANVGFTQCHCTVVE
jgi:hypothetical protein